jgi:Domain of unknown function (DUF4351)
MTLRLGSREVRDMPYMTSFVRLGIIDAHVKTVLRQLNKKLGEVPIELQEQIRSFSIAQLETLFDDLLDFETINDLADWLHEKK